LIESSVLTWCDEKCAGFEDEKLLEKAKRSGRAYIRVSERCCLPTVYQLTGDTRWGKGGKYRELYDLGIEEDDQYEDGSEVLPEIETKDFIEENSVTLDADGADNVLSGKTRSGVNFQNDRLGSELVPARIGNLPDEFREPLQIN
jgi:hypothetical protein